MGKFKQRNKKSQAPFKSDRQGGEGSTQHLTPHFSFEKMQEGTGYSVGCCSQEERAALATKLFELSQITWSTINGSNRHGMGCETIKRSSFKVSLPTSVTDDVTLLAFRYNGKKAMIGYRDGRVFYVLILDWNFTAYNHGS